MSSNNLIINYLVETPLPNKNNQILHQTSSLKAIEYGIPQGSVLGPLLFLCHLKGVLKLFSNNLNSKLCLNADDANLIVTGN